MVNESISPLGSNYGRIIEPVSSIFNNEGIIKRRIVFECIYFIELIGILSEHDDYYDKLDDYVVARISRIMNGQLDRQLFDHHHQETKHEIKAIEYYLKDKFKELDIPYSEMIHFGLTSQDIVDPVYAVLIKDISIVLIEKLENLMRVMNSKILDHRKTPMMSRTHGQPATPTTFGKELMVYMYRLMDTSKDVMDAIAGMRCKFGGAVGNLSVHYYHFPDIDWSARLDEFIYKNTGLERCDVTTQVNPNDDKAKVFDSFKRVNNALLDLSSDMWYYFSYGYLRLRRTKGYVGSSTMAHKNNPMEFENAMGNLEMSSSDLSYLSNKLTVSKMQRDLSDSTVQRNYGMVLSRVLLSYHKICEGIEKLVVDEDAMMNDITSNIQCCSEFIQTHAKLALHEDEYESIKHHLISRKVSMDDINELSTTMNMDLKSIIGKLVESNFYIGDAFDKQFDDMTENIIKLLHHPLFKSSLGDD